jgi:dipeptide/tripeptide permease
MKQHRFDPLSFVFGAIFVLIASAYAIGGENIDFDAWVLPASIMFLGIGLLLVSIRGLSSSSRATADDLSDQ